MNQSLSQSSKRIESIDLLRGLVMIIMALDHSRELFHIGAFTSDPLNLATTTPVLFFTRWVTHFCAPVFVFLAGVSVWLQSRRKTPKELSYFLISRGIWFIIFDLTIMTLAILGDIHFEFFVFQTIGAIGISMAILGMFIWLPFNAILITGLIIVFGHNLLDLVEMKHTGPYPFWWSMLHVQGIQKLWGNHQLFILYPFLAWTGLMMMGYCCGKILTSFNEMQWKKILLRIGIGLLLIFVILRTINMFVFPFPVQKNLFFSFLSFINVQKYPPSLLFMSITIGPALIFLSLVKNTQSRFARIISVYGRVPFFYYVLHFYVLHLISIALFLVRGHSIAEGIQGVKGLPFKFMIPGEGYSLVFAYIMWIVVVVALYPLCLWYDRYKISHKDKRWLSYL